MCCSLLDKLKDELKFPKLTSNKRYFHCLYELWAEPTDTGCWTVEWRCFVLSFLLYKGDIKKCFYPTQPPAGPVTLKTNPNSFGNSMLACPLKYVTSFTSVYSDTQYFSPNYFNIVDNYLPVSWESRQKCSCFNIWIHSFNIHPYFNNPKWLQIKMWKIRQYTYSL